MSLFEPIAGGISMPEAVRLAAAFKVLSEPHRLRILSLMAQQEWTAAVELERHIPLTQPTIGHHLSVLREAGMAEGEKRGPAKREPRAITIAELERRFDVAGASYWFGSTWCPAVGTYRGGYQVRFVKTETLTMGSRNVTYDWFELAADGTIAVAPRGYAREFKPGRVVDIAEAVERYATPPSDAKRFRL